MNAHKTPALLFALCPLVANVAPAAEHPEIKLWPNAVPGETGQIDPQKYGPPRSDGGTLRIAYVGNPTMTLYRAPADEANGCAVVVCPGGGYNILAWDKEGTEIAELHIYSRGGHGYGMRPSDNPVSNWPKRCEQWMRTSGLLDEATSGDR